jgi:hypothetical protein
MSQENVDVVRRTWEAFLAGMEHGDFGAWLDLRRRRRLRVDTAGLPERLRPIADAKRSLSSCAPDRGLRDLSVELIG